MQKSILDYDTVALNDDKGSLDIIDQTRLPYEIKILSLTKLKDIWEAIYYLKVRGAPAIGVAAAIGLYLVAKDIKADNYETFYNNFIEAKKYLTSARPTAVNLFWALNRMEDIVKVSKDKSVEEIKHLLHDEAVNIREEDIKVCKKIGEYGLTLLKPGNRLLTHCNAGKLATVKYGTATAPMYLGHERGYGFKIFTDETRPLLQGIRLTAFELKEAGMDVTVICDNMSSAVMKKGWVDAVFTGCDRVASNGDAANKIGTLGLAIISKRYNVPFYICSPTSTIDMSKLSGNDINIEERPCEEVTEMWYKERMAPAGINVFNPVFDVTDNDLITGIITEYGIARPPYNESLKGIFLLKEQLERKI